MSIWSDPHTFWLNITNIVLGVVTLACIVLVGQAVICDVLERVAKRSHTGATEADLHVVQLGELGLTMADGGEPIDGNDKREKR